VDYECGGHVGDYADRREILDRIVRAASGSSPD
jgi:hypothetical protein